MNLDELPGGGSAPAAVTRVEARCNRPDLLITGGSSTGRRSNRKNGGADCCGCGHIKGDLLRRDVKEGRQSLDPDAVFYLYGSSVAIAVPVVRAVPNANAIDSAATPAEL